MNAKLKVKIMESLSAVLPITGIVLIVSILLVPMEIGTVMMFLTGALMLVIGMGFFQLGAEMSMSPLGEGIGAQITKTQKIAVVALIGLVMGTIITIAEPDLQVLAEQVPSIPNLTLTFTVAIGVGIFLSIAILRILLKINLSYLLIGFYVILIGVSVFAPRNFLAVAFDAGGVTTGPITVPFIMAMGAGLAASRSDRNAADDSFGLVALSSIGPIMAVMLLGLFYKPTEASYIMSDASVVVTTRDVARVFLTEIPRYMKEVSLSILPILAVFFVFRVIAHRHNHRQLIRALVGFGYTLVGLILFLCGVNVGFAPVGTQLGHELAAIKQNWLLIPIGMLIGFYIVKAEPAIQILNRQIQTVTNGAISRKSMNTCLSIGVCVSVGLSMTRVLTGVSILWIIIPGYIIALILSLFVPKIFVGIAFDSGGVASGPMTTTFLLPLCIGACREVGGNIMTDAFGAVALVALTPLIAVQLMGVQYSIKMRKLQKAAMEIAVLPDDGDSVVEIEEA